MLRHFIDGKVDNVYSSVVRRYISDAEQKNNRELISEIYCELKNNYRNEYFYKNTLLNKLLLGVHSVNTTTALTEMAIAKSKADFVLINGKGVIFKLLRKSEYEDILNIIPLVKTVFTNTDRKFIFTCFENIKKENATRERGVC